MRYFALATDYDGTLAADGLVNDNTIAALKRLRASGRKLIMVTGRELDDLQRVFEDIDLFDYIVAENGALLYSPATREEKLLGAKPPDEFVKMLRDRQVDPLSVGRVIVATWHPNETTVLQTIRDLGLELQVIFNKGAVMVLPSGINKAAVGKSPEQNIEQFCKIVGHCPPKLAASQLEPGEARAWFRTDDTEPLRRITPGRTERRRHLRKYAEEKLGTDKSFYFTGAEGKLNLRAQNLILFTQIAEGVDDETWLYHLQQGDYSHWFHEAIKDESLAEEVKQIEQTANISAQDSRKAIKEAIEQRYTLPE